MRSKDIARIAGVTPRTLRHYHRIGLLAEPERDANNYRRYDVHHLVRLLRIRRLSALGFALDDISGLLDAGGDKAKDALAALDRELESQIEHLSRRRALIANLAASPDLPDVPVELAPFNEAFTSGLSEKSRQLAREQTVLLAHLADRDDMPTVIEVFRRISQPEAMAALVRIGERFNKLDGDTDSAEVASVTEDFLTVLKKLGLEKEGANSLNRPGATKLLFGHALRDTNAVQRRVFEEVLRRF